MKLKEVEAVPERSRWSDVVPILDKFRDSGMKVAEVEGIKEEDVSAVVYRFRYAIGSNLDRWPNMVVFCRQKRVYLSKFEDGRR